MGRGGGRKKENAYLSEEPQVTAFLVRRAIRVCLRQLGELGGGPTDLCAVAFEDLDRFVFRTRDLVLQRRI